MLVSDGAGGNTGCPGVGDIVCESWSVDVASYWSMHVAHTGTVVVCLEQGEEGADSEDVGVFGKHLDDVDTLERCASRCRTVSGNLVSTREEVEEHARKIARYIPPEVESRQCGTPHGCEGSAGIAQIRLSQHSRRPRSR